MSRKDKLNALIRVIDDYYSHAFSPEIINVLNIIENDEIKALLKAPNIGELGASSGVSHNSQSKNFQIELMRIEREFRTALEFLK